MKTNIAPIYSRELRSLFNSPVAYLVLAVFTVIALYFWGSIVAAYSNYCQQQMFRGGGAGATFKLMEWLFAPYWGNLMVTFLFVLPLISMRAFSEEKKNGTIELLFTYPFSDLDILLGKYLAQISFVGVMLLIPASFSLSLLGLASIEWLTVLIGLSGLVLVAGAFLALGTLASSATENQVISAVLGFGALLLLFVIDWVAKSGSSVFHNILGELSVAAHYEPFSKGVLSLKDLSFFAFFIAFCLFSTLRVLESKKWR